MAITFPASPNIGDQHIVGSRIWEWDGSAWVGVSGAGGGDATSIKSKTVTVDALSDGDILVYRSGADEWEVETKMDAPPSDGNYYAYKDGAWVNITNKIINP
jgi:hypothetical protein